MNRMKTIFIAIIAFALMGMPAMAKASTQRSRRLSEQQVRNLLQRLESHSDRFRSSVDQALDRSRIDGSKAEDNINQFVKDFEAATDRLKDRFDDDNAATMTALEVLRRAARIDAFMRQHVLMPAAQTDWRSLRGSLDQLAVAYHTSWRWM